MEIFVTRDADNDIKAGLVLPYDYSFKNNTEAVLYFGHKEHASSLFYVGTGTPVGYGCHKECYIDIKNLQELYDDIFNIPVVISIDAMIDRLDLTNLAKVNNMLSSIVVGLNNFKTHVENKEFLYLEYSKKSKDDEKFQYVKKARLMMNSIFVHILSKLKSLALEPNKNNMLHTVINFLENHIDTSPTGYEKLRNRRFTIQELNNELSEITEQKIILNKLPLDKQVGGCLDNVMKSKYTDEEDLYVGYLNIPFSKKKILVTDIFTGAKYEK